MQRKSLPAEAEARSPPKRLIPRNPRCEIRHNLLELRITPQSIPKGMELQVAVAQAARNLDGCPDLMDGHLSFSAPGIDHAEVSHQFSAVERVFGRRQQLDGVLPVP